MFYGTTTSRGPAHTDDVTHRNRYLILKTLLFLLYNTLKIENTSKPMTYVLKIIFVLTDL